MKIAYLCVCVCIFITQEFYYPTAIHLDVFMQLCNIEIFLKRILIILLRGCAVIVLKLTLLRKNRYCVNLVVSTYRCMQFWLFLTISALTPWSPGCSPVSARGSRRPRHWCPSSGPRLRAVQPPLGSPSDLIKTPGTSCHSSAQNSPLFLTSPQGKARVPTSQSLHSAPAPTCHFSALTSFLPFPWFSLFQAHRPPCCSLNMLGTTQPWGLYTCSLLYWAHAPQTSIWVPSSPPSGLCSDVTSQ